MRSSWWVGLLLVLGIWIEFALSFHLLSHSIKDKVWPPERGRKLIPNPHTTFRGQYDVELLKQIFQEQDKAQGIALGFSPEFTPAGLFVVHNMVTHLPDEWVVVLATKMGKNEGKQRELLDEMMDNIPPHQKGKRTIVLAPILSPRFTRPAYSCLLLQTELYEAVPTEQLLIFQEDTLILRKDDGKKDRNATRFEYLRDFFRFPYIGAPWIWRNCQEKWNEDKLCRDSGNGGLSLRNKHAMINITKQIPTRAHPSCLSEDLVLTAYLDVSPFFPLLPPRSVGRQFAVETIPSEEPWGVHKPWLTGRFPQWISRFPELLLLQILQQKNLDAGKDLSHNLSVFFWWIQEQGLSEDYFRKIMSLQSTISEHHIQEAIEKKTDFSLVVQSYKKGNVEIAPDKVYLNHRGNPAYANSWWNKNRYKQTKDSSFIGQVILRQPS